MTDVVTVFCRHEGRVLLVRRSDAVGTYAGRWGGVSGYVEGDPADAVADARREVREETGLDAACVRAGDPLDVVDGDREWRVHPFLFAAASRDVDPNEELADWAWVHPHAMRDRATVPALWPTYERVAPTVATVRDDRDHGAAWCANRALEVLRDRAATADDWASVAAVARELAAARPAMVVVANRVNRAMAAADRTPEAVRDRAAAVLDDAVTADRESASSVASLLDGPVATLSRSGTVLAALDAADVPAVVGESRVAREGVATAERLAPDATLVADAVLPGTLAGLDGRPETASALVGADAVLSDGSVVNRTGTYPLALAAADADRPFRVVAARDKVVPEGRSVDHGGTGDETPYDGDAPVDVAAPLFERVPARLVDGVVTESGVLDAAEVRAVAAAHRDHADWDDGQ